MDMSMEKLQLAMIKYMGGDARRIQHFLKVHALAKLIGQGEHLPEKTQLILELAGLTHDIGIKNGELKYGKGKVTGKIQEQEGPAEGEKLLTALGYDRDVIDRVCFLIGHHHTLDAIDGPDYQILVEADFLVNLYEDGVSEDGVKTALSRVFKTKTGIDLCRTMFGLAES